MGEFTGAGPGNGNQVGGWSQVQRLETGTQWEQFVRVAVGSSNRFLYLQKPIGNHFIFAVHRLQEKV